jgi:uncharacterized protein (TIGR03067 family)
MKPLLVALLVAGLIGTAWAAPNKDHIAQREKENLQGEWKSVITEGYGKDAPNEELKTIYLTFKGDQLFAKYGKKTAEATYKLIPSEGGPSQIDFTVTKGPEAVEGKTLQGIYRLEGDTLRIMYREPGKPRPDTFMEEDMPVVYMIFLKKEMP